VAEVDDYHFTYPDIGTTLQRLLALQQGNRWEFTAVLAVDKLSLALAAALSELSGLPLRQISDLEEEDRALLVIAVARESELFQMAMERAPCVLVAFCLGLNWLRHSKLLPDIIGIAARGACSVPWEAELRRLRADGSPTEQIDACIANARDEIVRTVHATPPEKNLPRQVRYYSRSHRRLSFSSM
jgi:hypothetical protein